MGQPGSPRLVPETTLSPRSASSSQDLQDWEAGNEGDPGLQHFFTWAD